jgi:predicted transposase YdaD
MRRARSCQEDEGRGGFIVSTQSIVDQLRAEGRDEGRDEGRAEGRAEGEARALLTVLRGRGIAVPDAARERILAERDRARLERWLEKAGTAATVAELLEEPS